MSVSTRLRTLDRYDASMLLFYIGVGVVGAIGIWITPSPAIRRAVGAEAAAWVFSLGMLTLGPLAASARYARRGATESRLLLGIGAMTLIHGLVLMRAGEGGLQTGLRLVIAPALIVHYAQLRRDGATLALVREELGRYRTEQEDMQ